MDRGAAGTASGAPELLRGCLPQPGAKWEVSNKKLGLLPRQVTVRMTAAKIGPVVNLDLLARTCHDTMVVSVLSMEWLHSDNSHLFDGVVKPTSFYWLPSRSATLFVPGSAIQALRVRAVVLGWASFSQVKNVTVALVGSVSVVAALPTPAVTISRVSPSQTPLLR